MVALDAMTSVSNSSRALANGVRQLADLILSRPSQARTHSSCGGRTMNDRRAAITLSTLFTAGCALAASAVRAGITIIAASGDSSPSGNGTLSLFNAPTLNAPGQVAFVAQLAGTSGGNDDNLVLQRAPSRLLGSHAWSASAAGGTAEPAGCIHALSALQSPGSIKAPRSAGGQHHTRRTATRAAKRSPGGAGGF
jgi:hypothetical protein